MKKLSSVMSMNTENTYEKFISEKVLKDNYDEDKEAFQLVELALFMKSSYSNGEDANKLTDADYEKMQKEFVKTKKYQQLEEYVTIQ